MTELTISLETGSDRPLYEQIYNHIKTEILDGGLPFQERLPSTRKLAQYLQVSRSTVDMAYEQLYPRVISSRLPAGDILSASWTGSIKAWRRRQKRPEPLR